MPIDDIVVIAKLVDLNGGQVFAIPIGDEDVDPAILDVIDARQEVRVEVVAAVYAADNSAYFNRLHTSVKPFDDGEGRQAE